MDDKELKKKAADKNSSCDESEINNGRFRQRMQGKFTLSHVLRNEDKAKISAKISAQRKQKFLYGKDSKYSTIVPQELKDAKSEKGYPGIKKFNLEEISSSSCDESYASSSSTDDESSEDKKVAHHNWKCSKTSKSPNINESNLYSTCRPCDHASTSFADIWAFPSTSFAHSCADPRTIADSFEDSSAGSSEDSSAGSSEDSIADIFGDRIQGGFEAVLRSILKDRAAPTTGFEDDFEAVNTSDLDSYENTDAGYKVPSTRSACVHKDIDLIGIFKSLCLENLSDTSEINISDVCVSDAGSPTEMSHYSNRESKPLDKSCREIKKRPISENEHGFENSVIKGGNFSDKSSVETNISDYSDVESPTAMTHYTYRKRKSFYKSDIPIYEHNTQLKKKDWKLREGNNI